jgi:hypothetical protein
MCTFISAKLCASHASLQKMFRLLPSTRHECGITVNTECPLYYNVLFDIEIYMLFKFYFYKIHSDFM